MNRAQYTALVAVLLVAIGIPAVIASGTDGATSGGAPRSGGSSGTSDPLVPADGTQNITGGLTTSGGIAGTTGAFSGAVTSTTGAFTSGLVATGGTDIGYTFNSTALTSGADYHTKWQNNGVEVLSLGANGNLATAGALSVASGVGITAAGAIQNVTTLATSGTITSSVGSGSVGLALGAGAISAATSAPLTGTSGTCTSESYTGNAVRGVITATCTAGQTVIASWSATRVAAALCTLTPTNAAAAAVSSGAAYIGTTTTSAITITVPTAATAGTWNYVCIE